MKASTRLRFRDEVRRVKLQRLSLSVAVLAVTLIGATPAMSAPAAAGAELISAAKVNVVLEEGAHAWVIPQAGTPADTAYTYVWSDETGELARQTTTQTFTTTFVGREKFGRTFTVSVTAVAPDGRTATVVSAPVVATRWPQGGIAYDTASKQFELHTPHLPAHFEAELGRVSVSYRWSRSGTPIAPPVSATPWAHARVPADEGHSLSVEMLTEQTATTASSAYTAGPTPAVGVVQVSLTTTGAVGVGHNVNADIVVKSWYPGNPAVVPNLECTHQWYRNGRPLYGQTHGSHHIHTMERSTTLQATVRCSSPGYLPITRSTAKLVVPGVPYLVSLQNGDALRDLGLFWPGLDTLMIHLGRVGSFDLRSGGGSSSALPTRSVNSIALAGDLDDDGHENLVARDSAGSLWSYSYGQYRVRIGSGWNSMNLIVAGGDFTGDRMADILARRSTGELVFYEGRGRQGLAAGKVVATSTFRNARRIITLGDANGDGRADLHVQWANGDLAFYAGKGNGTFAAPVRVGAGWGQMSKLLTGRDLNRDGKADLLALDTQGRLWLYPGNGKGGFTARSVTNSGYPLGTGIY